MKTARLKRLTQSINYTAEAVPAAEEAAPAAEAPAAEPAADASPAAEAPAAEAPAAEAPAEAPAAEAPAAEPAGMYNMQSHERKRKCVSFELLVTYVRDDDCLVDVVTRERGDVLLEVAGAIDDDLLLDPTTGERGDDCPDE